MDGLSDVFWTGDEVLWSNLLRHYVMSFTWYACGWLMRDSEGYQAARIHGHLCEEDLPTDRARALCREAFDTLLARDEMKDTPRLLAQLPMPLRRQGLQSFLMAIHSTVARTTFEVFHRHKLHPQKFPHREDALELEKYLRALAALPGSADLRGYDPSDFLEMTGQISSSSHGQMRLIFLADKDCRAAKWRDLLGDFPERYMEALIRDLRHMPWRAACFSRTCTNASMWGVYAQAHSGAALVFRPAESEGGRTLSVHGMRRASDRVSRLELVSVRYSERPPPIDFFVSIGRIPEGKLESTWFKSRTGEVSSRLAEYTSDIAAWRSVYTAQGPRKACWKHTDWRHEEEERLVATSALFNDPAPEALTYDFAQLEGLVFGMRTTTEDRLRMCKIIESKCREAGRTHFRFFESTYWPAKGRMFVSELKLLQFKGI